MLEEAKSPILASFLCGFFGSFISGNWRFRAFGFHVVGGLRFFLRLLVFALFRSKIRVSRLRLLLKETFHNAH